MDTMLFGRHSNFFTQECHDAAKDGHVPAVLLEHIEIQSQDKFRLKDPTEGRLGWIFLEFVLDKASDVPTTVDDTRDVLSRDVRTIRELTRAQERPDLLEALEAALVGQGGTGP